ncbi:MAG: FKBP-type peptidyl-prolyl cis-trans isomerase [Patescibacteria group bacterium]
MKRIISILALIIIAVVIWYLYTNSDLFIRENATNNSNNTMTEDYITTNSGLKYKIINETAQGARPSGPTSQVEVHYEGRLTDGTIFDSSRARGEAITFGLNQVIAGWSEGVQLMSEGDTYEFYIPANLGYGAKGVPGVIPPNADLIFEVELIKVLN